MYEVLALLTGSGVLLVLVIVVIIIIIIIVVVRKCKCMLSFYCCNYFIVKMSASLVFDNK